MSNSNTIKGSKNMSNKPQFSCKTLHFTKPTQSQQLQNQKSKLNHQIKLHDQKYTGSQQSKKADYQKQALKRLYQPIIWNGQQNQIEVNERIIKHKKIKKKEVQSCLRGQQKIQQRETQFKKMEQKNKIKYKLISILGNVNSFVNGPNNTPINLFEYDRKKIQFQHTSIKQYHPYRCNCMKTNCRKKYCQCFSKGKICCDQCRCIKCQNNQMQKGIKTPLSFNYIYPKPHRQFCHCSRSGCLKNYCQCFREGYACEQRCKCLNCMNLK